jgi:endoglucanase Acf2
MQAGDKVWVWHFGTLKEIEITGVTVIQNAEAVLYPGFATSHFFLTRNEAVENRLATMCSLAIELAEKPYSRERIEHLKEIAQSTVLAVEKTRDQSNVLSTKMAGTPS